MFEGKPVIGVMPLLDEERDSYWMLPGYMKGLEEQGAIPLMPPLTGHADMLDYFLESCDGFILTGGQDVSPALYGQEPSERCGIVSGLRDCMDAYILRGAVERDKAVLGICRGHQLMNAVFGGTLYQDLPSEAPSEVEHRMKPPYDRCAHMVKLLPGAPLHAMLGREDLPVNSCHHQAVKELAGPFKAMAVATDGLIEGIYMPDRRFVWGVQWHPEFSYRSSRENRDILGALVEAAKRR